MTVTQAASIADRVMAIMQQGKDEDTLMRIGFADYDKTPEGAPFYFEAGSLGVPQHRPEKFENRYGKRPTIGTIPSDAPALDIDWATFER